MFKVEIQWVSNGYIVTYPVQLFEGISGDVTQQKVFNTDKVQEMLDFVRKGIVPGEKK